MTNFQKIRIMKDPLAIAIGLVFFTLVSCKPEGRIYEKHKDLSPNVEWLRSDVRSFAFQIDDTISSYEVGVALRYASGFVHQYGKVSMVLTSPSGKSTEHMFSLKVREDNGDYIGEPGFEIWDSHHPVLKNVFFEESGEYTATFQHAMERDPMNMVMEIGLTIDKE